MGLSKSTNSEKIAKEILSMCPFIENSMLHNLEEVIEEMKQNEIQKEMIAADGSFLPRFSEFFDDINIGKNGNEFDETTSEEPEFGKLDHYIDLLYEETPQKIEASNCLAKLTKCNSYLRDISRHGMTF